MWWDIAAVMVPTIAAWVWVLSAHGGEATDLGRGWWWKV